jgi:type I restriction enzyme S subunit
VARIEALFARIRQARADLLRIAPLAEHLWRTRLIASVTGSDQIATDGGADIAQPANDPDLAGVWPVDGVPSSWSWLPFTAAFDDVTSSQNKLQQKAYLASGQFPVIDQGEAEIGGWSDDENLVYRGTLPVIVFGDHTRAVKYVERPFIQGADGVKLLAPRGSILHPRFAFWMLKALPLPDKGYARHMKFLRASFLPVPPLCEQKRIAESLDRSSLRSGVMTHEATRALALLDHLERSILTRAFRGELVPQDPADEPAAATLSRLAETTVPPAPRRRRASAA